MTLLWNETRKQLGTLRTDLHEKRGVRNQLLKSKSEENAILTEARKNKEQSEKAHLFLLSEITNRRKQAIGVIEGIGSDALQMVYGDGYGIQFYDFEDVRKAGSNTFKMEIQMVSPFGKNKKPLVTKLFGARGGGGIEVSSFSLRLGALDWHQYHGPVLLDEAFKSMSKDKKIHMVARWIHSIHDVTGRQIIFATHMGDIFGKIADNILYVHNDMGQSAIKQVEYDEMSVLLASSDEIDENN